MTTIVVAALAALSAASAAAAPPPSANAPEQQFDGFWAVDEAARRAGAAAATRAELTPAGREIQQRNQAAAAERTRRGELVNVNAATCGYIGVPFIVGVSEPWRLTVSKDVVVQTAERYQLSPRYFWMDGRTFPNDIASLPTSSSGYSIGRWDGKDLVVETRGMWPGGVAGGGLKGPKAVLTERFSLSPDGKRLTWTLTFEDPELMTKPVTYNSQYDRIEDPNTYAMFQICDPNNDPSRLVGAPEQQGPAQ